MENTKQEIEWGTLLEPTEEAIKVGVLEEDDIVIALGRPEELNRVANSKKVRCMVRGFKTPKNLNTDFVKIADEQKIVVEKDTERLAKAINKVAKEARSILDSGLSERALIILIQDRTDLSQSEIREVLGKLANLDKYTN